MSYARSSRWAAGRSDPVTAHVRGRAQTAHFCVVICFSARPISRATTLFRETSDAEPDQGPSPRNLARLGRWREQRVLHEDARPASRQEDGELRCARYLSPVLW